MIRGRVLNREAVVELEIASRSHPGLQISAVIDTGFTGWLTLAAPVVAALQPPFAGHRRGRLADGSMVLMEVYEVSVTWHGQRHPVLALQADGTPLVGMSLLDGSKLVVDVAQGGDVLIEELPTP